MIKGLRLIRIISKLLFFNSNIFLQEFMKGNIMRWKGRRGSSNVEDRRHLSPKGKGILGGGIGGIVLVVVVMLLGGDPSTILENVPTGGTSSNYVETPK